LYGGAFSDFEELNSILTKKDILMKSYVNFCFIVLFAAVLSGCVQKLAKCPGDVFSANILNELITTDNQCTSEKDEEEKERILLYALLATASSNSSSTTSTGGDGNYSDAMLSRILTGIDRIVKIFLAYPRFLKNELYDIIKEFVYSYEKSAYHKVFFFGKILKNC
jgi:hypothetical protein